MASHSDSGRQSDIPRPLTSFVGRKAEIAAVVELLSRPDVRLVTLIGPGGVGKTRLALQVADIVDRDTTDRVVFVPLAPIRDPALLLPTVAQYLGIVEVGGEPMMDQVRLSLQDRTALLVLDNFEHVVDGASVITELLTACPGLTVLVTSRTVLRVSGEYDFPVLPLDLPASDGQDSPEALSELEAVQLFVDRAKAVDPSFALTSVEAAAISEIVRRLDGLPLAIELAAARVTLLPPDALLTRLDERLKLLTDGSRDAPPRLQDMRSAISWSYDLLSPDEQSLFQRLSVFVGGFTLAGAEYVATDDDIDVLNVLGGLVAQSLVRQESRFDGEPRYRKLETVREFGIEQLAASGRETAAQSAHAAYFLDFVETALPHFDGPGLSRWLKRIDAEHSNVRAALAWAGNHGELETMARIAGAMWRYWMSRGYLKEGRQWLDRVKALHREADRFVPVEAQVGVGAMAVFRGDMVAATNCAEDLLRHADATGDSYGAFWAHIWKGLSGQNQGDTAKARDEFELALTYAPMTRTPEGYSAVALMNLAELDERSGDLEVAAEQFGSALKLFQSSENVWGQAVALANLGTIANSLGEHEQASVILRQSLDFREQLDDRPGCADALARLAQVAVAADQLQLGARLLGAVDSLLRSMGMDKSFFTPAGLLDEVAAAAGAGLGEKAFADCISIGRTLTLDDAIAEAGAAGTEAGIRIADGGHSRASQPYGLTSRELEVLHLIADGSRDLDIAEALGISRRTVTSHVTSILTKLGVESRTAAATQAVRENLV